MDTLGKLLGHLQEGTLGSIGFDVAGAWCCLVLQPAGAFLQDRQGEVHMVLVASHAAFSLSTLASDRADLLLGNIEKAVFT